jgi:hypothetical protein
MKLELPTDKEFATMRYKMIQAWHAMRWLEALKADGADIDWEAYKEARDNYQELYQDALSKGAL